MSDLSTRLKSWLYASFFTAFFLVLIASQLVAGTVFSGIQIHGPREQDRVVIAGKPVLEQILKQGRLVVLTRNGPTTYYLERDTQAGFEYDLAKAFADSLGVEIEFRIQDNTPALLGALEDGQAHLVASNLIANDVPQDGRFALGPSYDVVRQQLVCHRKAKIPSSKDALGDVSIMVIAESSYEKRLRRLEETIPGLEWATIYNLSTEDLMQRVADRSIGCTVGDSTLVSINRRYYPALSVPFDLSGPLPMSWVIPARASELQSVMERWFAEPETKKLVKALHERYYGHVPAYDYVDLQRFQRRIDERLPKYKAAFQKEGDKHGIPWTLLAAMGYQESHWRPRAKSPTGVRGLMMLTLPTAKEVGVKNRLDPMQSIRGGAKYLAGLVKRVPEDVVGEDRIWYAIAAYNVGFGHMRDAQALAKRLGRNPNLWADLKNTLPLLTQPAFYNTLTHGYARGNEPVLYVQRVRHYQDILERQFQAPAWSQAALFPSS